MNDLDGQPQQPKNITVSQVDNLRRQLQNLPPALRLHMVKIIADTLDDINRSTVAEIREQGQTWEQIGKILGVSKQAVHGKYGQH
jgi:hypothetical protein